MSNNSRIFCHSVRGAGSPGHSDGAVEIASYVVTRDDIEAVTLLPFCEVMYYAAVGYALLGADADILVNGED